MCVVIPAAIAAGAGASAGAAAAYGTAATVAATTAATAGAGISALSVASLVATIAGTGASALSSAQQGAAAQDAANYQAQIDENNAVIAEQNAQAIEAEGRVQESQTRRRGEAIKGAQRAAFAASNIVVDEGDALSTIVDTAGLTEYDVLVGRTNTQNLAISARNQRGVFLDSAANRRLAGKSARRAGLIRGTTDILGGLGILRDDFFSLRRAGAF